MDYNGFYMAVMISLLTALFTSLSIALFITFVLLKKYSDYGDSTCGIDEYSHRGINIRRRIDNVMPDEKNDYFSVYADNPYENKTHSIPEQLLKNSRDAHGKSSI